jgi:hypothetical protein
LLQAALWSGGPANITNARAVSAPNRPMMSRGSTTLFLLFDIFSVPPNVTGCPSSRAVTFSGRPLSSYSMSISAG